MIKQIRYVISMIALTTISVPPLNDSAGISDRDVNFPVRRKTDKKGISVYVIQLPENPTIFVG